MGLFHRKECKWEGVSVLERYKRFTLIELLVAILSSGPMAIQGMPQQRPNVVFILADDLGIGGLNCYGTDWLETPNIDRLCAAGLKCTGGLAPFPVCAPSRAVTLTGQYAPRTGLYRVADRHAGLEDKIRFIVPANGHVSPDISLINKPFKEAGYATAMYGKWHISPEKKQGMHPVDYGFDDAVVSAGRHYQAETTPRVDIPEGITVEEVLTDRAINFMENAVGKQHPFFLYMPYFWIHRPLEADPRMVAYFEKKLQGREFIGKHPQEIPILAAMTRMLDTQIGRLLGTLDALGVTENTIVVFSSDNGSFNENMVGPYRGKKGDTYDGGMRVPYIFKWPGHIGAGSTTDERFMGVDLYPTLISLAGLRKPDDHILDGIDLSPLLLGTIDRLPQRELYCFYPKYAQFNNKTQRWSASWRNVIYQGNYKLIEYPEYEYEEIFNLAADPFEKEDIVTKAPDTRNILVETLHRWLDEVKAPLLTPNPDYSLEDQTDEDF